MRSISTAVRAIAEAIAFQLSFARSSFERFLERNSHKPDPTGLDDEDDPPKASITYYP